MALIDRILQDNQRVFMQTDHFASYHTWNGKRFLCVVDEEAALKRKNNNVVDVSWDNNTTEKILYVKKDNWPVSAKPKPNTSGFFDAVSVKILQVNEDIGMYTIVIVSNMPKEARD